MSWFKDYQQTIDQPALRQAIEETRNDFVNTILDDYDYMSDLQVLLYGDVQSGKTSHMLGIVGEALDRDFQTVIILTSPNTRLVDQTHSRVFTSLTNVQVCKADLTNDFLLNHKRPIPMPTVIVLGKIPTVLDNWLEVFRQTRALEGRPVLVIDDEGDATSQNTKVNSDDVSRINHQLTQLRRMATGAIYMQVTGTPQAILLQGESSGWAAQKALHFSPGKDYVGGSLFFNQIPNPYLRVFSDSASVEDLNIREAVQTFLLTCGIFALEGKATCNMIAHPSHRTPDHDDYQRKMQKVVATTMAKIDDHAVREELKRCHEQLCLTYTEAPSFEETLQSLRSLDGKFNFPIINARTETVSGDWEQGYNLITGGNSLGRGLTFDWLQTVFYVRDVKKPQADTLWQHARMFGYKRHRPTMRVFMPATIANNFRETHEGNEIIKRDLSRGVAVTDLRIGLGGNVSPTRKNVLDKRIIGKIVNGVNYFAANPFIKDFEGLDDRLNDLRGRFGDDFEVSPQAAIKLSEFFTTRDGDLDLQSFRIAFDNFSQRHPDTLVRVVIRTARQVHQGTGVLLSPNDQVLAKSETKRPLLILYRIEGANATADAKKGHGKWSRDPIWVPNFKMPEGPVFWRTVG